MDALTSLLLLLLLLLSPTSSSKAPAMPGDTFPHD